MFLIFTKKHIAIFLTSIGLFIGVFILYATEQIVGDTVAVGNWGLSFSTEGEIPIGNQSAEFLSQYNSYFVGNDEGKEVYLTFDAGFENGYTESILGTLKKHDVKAVFFLVGNYLETAPELVQRMADEGHIVGNHTYSHPDMSVIADEEAFKAELARLEEVYKEITGEEMLKVYRPPQGKYSEENLKLAFELGYSTYFWSLAYVDWYVDDQPTEEEALSKLIPRTHDGAIVLLHNTSETNAKILDTYISTLKDEGYEFKLVTEIGK